MNDRDIPRRSRILFFLLLVFGTAAADLAGFGLMSRIGAPFYADTIGTITASLLGGYMPAMIGGFIANATAEIFSPDYVFYTILNMLTAFLVHKLNKHGMFKKLRGIVCGLLILVVIAGIADSVLALCLNNMSSEGLTSPIIEFVSQKTGLTGFAALLTGNILTELIDKSMSLAVAFLIVRLLPERFKAFAAEMRSIDEFSQGEKRIAVKRACRSMSLKTKVTLIIVPAITLIAGAATVVSNMLFKSYTIDEHSRLADRISDIEARIIDPARVDEFLAKSSAAEGYDETLTELRLLRESSPEVAYVYVYKIEEDGCHVVFDVDTEETEGDETGAVIPFDESFKPYLGKLLAGEPIDPIISDDSYGWLLSVYKPVYDAEGKCACYAAVDVSMTLISSYGIVFMSKLVALLMAILVMILAVGVWLVEHNIVLPVNTLAYCAGGLGVDSKEERAESIERLRENSITTGDEIENLYNAFLKTTKEIMQYVADIQTKTDTITRMQNGLIMVLADMVESRDKCTGDHVRKTAAYAELILHEMMKRGFYPETVTEEFAENVLHAAPLHDIGKIKISDTILNKPGKLTDEEFELMKLHTVYGSEIIDRAIEIVPDSGYLAEARNVSQYHHEKWNGKGYPEGLSGEDIPLSARIMAVADVFDALVSRRSYKKPFTFEKAIGIIREDAGSHFDPLVAEAFLGAEDEVRRIAENFDSMSSN